MKLLLCTIVLAIFISCNPNVKKYTHSSGVIYLENYDTLNINADKKFLEEFPFINKVDYISKEAAKEKYIGQGNQDWSKVLEENPLPASFELLIDIDDFNEEKATAFRTAVMDKIKSSTEVLLPQIIVK